jgi:hypothetical protein
MAHQQSLIGLLFAYVDDEILTSTTGAACPPIGPGTEIRRALSICGGRNHHDVG